MGRGHVFTDALASFILGAGRTGRKRASEEAFAEKSAQPAKKGPESTRYPCPRPGGCPAGTTNHIRRATCEGCNYDLLAHTAARKKAEGEAKKEKIPAFPVVLKAVNREIDKLGKLGCSASLMVHCPQVGKHATQWFFNSVGTKGKTFVDKYRGYFKKTVKNEGEEEVKVDEGAKSHQKVDGPAEQKSINHTGFTLSSNLEDFVRGFADRFPAHVIETMLSALIKHYIDEKTAKALDMDALQRLFGKNMLGPCLQFLSGVKDL